MGYYPGKAEPKNNLDMRKAGCLDPDPQSRDSSKLAAAPRVYSINSASNSAVDRSTDSICKGLGGDGFSPLLPVFPTVCVFSHLKIYGQ